MFASPMLGPAESQAIRRAATSAIEDGSLFGQKRETARDRSRAVP
jgi:hypothetical protein